MNANDVHTLPMEHRGIAAMTASVVLMALAIFLVLFRFYTRRSIINAVQSSDWMVLVSLLLSMTFVSIFIAEVQYGMGRHQNDITPGTSILQRKLFWISIPFYNAAMITAKASIIIQYFHVFSTKKMRIVCWVMGAILAVCGVWMVLSAFLNCIPVASFWNPAVSGHCLQDDALWYSNASLNMLTDMAILIIPIPVLVLLDLPLRQKVALCCIFALGWFVCITSICRLQSLRVLLNSDEPSYHALAVLMWSAVECNTGIICACLPTLRPAVTRIWPSLSAIIPGAPTSGQPGPSVSETTLREHGRGGMNIAPRGLESRGESVVTRKESTSATSQEQEQEHQLPLPPLPNVRMIPKPGNAFSQDLVRKGSFFEQRPSSYV